MINLLKLLISLVVVGLVGILDYFLYESGRFILGAIVSLLILGFLFMATWNKLIRKKDDTKEKDVLHNKN